MGGFKRSFLAASSSGILKPPLFYKNILLPFRHFFGYPIFQEKASCATEGERMTEKIIRARSKIDCSGFFPLPRN
jgi:hypothetical protein